MYPWPEQPEGLTGCGAEPSCAEPPKKTIKSSGFLGGRRG